MSTTAIIEAIKGTDFYNKGEPFGTGRISSALAARNMSNKLTQIKSAVAKMTREGELEITASGYQRPPKTKYWLAIPWRRRTNERLEINVEAWQV